MLPTDTHQNKITEEEKNKEKTESKIKEKLEEVEKKIDDERNKDNEKEEETNTEDAQTQENVKKELSPFLTSVIQEPEDKDKIKSKLESVTKNEIEDKENVIFEAKCNLYRFVQGKTTLEARGVGTIFISKVKESDLYKIVMNRDKINRLACNHYISPCADLSPHKTIKNLWIWHTFTDTSDKDSKLDSKQTFAVLIKDEKDYNTFKEKYDWAKEYNAKKYNKK